MKPVKIIHWAVDTILVVSLAVIVVALIAQVIARYWFHSALPWPEELSQFLLVTLSFFGTYRAVGSNLHIALNVLPEERFPVPIRLSKIVGLIMAAVFMAYVGYGGVHLMKSAWTQPSVALRLPMAVPYSVIVIASALTVLAILHQIGLIFRSIFRPENARSAS